MFYNFFFLIEMGSCYVAQAGVELLGLSDPPALPSQSTGTTGVSHCARPSGFFYSLHYPLLSYLTL